MSIPSVFAENTNSDNLTVNNNQNNIDVYTSISKENSIEFNTLKSYTENIKEKTKENNISTLGLKENPIRDSISTYSGSHSVKGNTFADIQSTIDSADEGDTILLNGTYFGNGRSIKSYKSLTIKSESGATLNANCSSYGILESYGNTLILDNLNFKNAFDPFYNNTEVKFLLGAVYIEGNYASVSNCNFSFNYANYGAAIEWYVDNGRIINSTFEFNFATNGGGGAINAVSNDKLDIIGSIFKYNWGDEGGAIRSNCNILNIINSNFTYGVGNYGGAINVVGGSANIVNSIFESNKGICNGSSIYSNSKLNITNCVFDNNSINCPYLSMNCNGSAVWGKLVSGNNILNAIYNNVSLSDVLINGVSPVNDYKNSQNGTLLYQESVGTNKSIIIQAWNNDKLIFNKTVITDADGKATVDISNFKDATEVNMTYRPDFILGYPVYNSTFNNSCYFLVPEDKFVILGENNSYKIKFTTADNESISGAEIKVKLYHDLKECEEFNIITDSEGNANVPLGNITGECIVEAFYPYPVFSNESSINHSFKIIPYDSYFVSQPFTENYGVNKNYTVMLCNVWGDPISGQEIKLRLYNSYGDFKDYYCTTNNEGIAKLNINLISGNWTIISHCLNSSYIIKDDNQTLNINSIKAILTPHDYTEYYGAHKNFTVNFNSENNEPLKGYELKLRLYNKYNEFKDYYRTTNSEGIAKLPIYLIHGEWKIECSFTSNNILSNPEFGTITIY